MLEAALQRCSFKKVFWKYEANLQETTMPKRDVNYVALQLWYDCFPVNLLNIFTTFFAKSTSGELRLKLESLAM